MDSPAEKDSQPEEPDTPDPLVELCRGRIPLETMRLPRKRMVRIYLTGTPDMRDEQHVIMTKFFPAMRAKCAIEYDLDLQIIAPHWNTGKAEEEFGDELIEICLSEIRTCERTVEVPIYVVLVGTSYGWRPPPTCLGKREFDYLVRHLRKIDINGPGFLRGWYEEDKNTDPSHVVLKFPKFLQDEGKSEAEEESAPQSVSTKLDLPQIARLLRVSSRPAAEAGHVEPDDVYKYERSVIDAEINYGILNNNDIKRRTFWFIRNIKDLDKRTLTSRRIASFLSMEGLSLDKVAHQRLIDLRDNTIPACVVEDAIFRWDLDFEDSGAQNILENHNKQVLIGAQKFRGKHKLMHITKYQNYLDELCGKLEQEVRNQIENYLINKQDSSDEYVDKMKMEIISDWKRAERLCQTFQGREDTLNMIKTWFAGEGDMPFVVYGDASIGKSALLAKIAVDLQCLTLYPPEEVDVPDAVIVIRFLDRSPLPCNVEDLLFSLCTQISLAYGNEGPDSHDANELMETFNECLTFSTEEKPLFLILDGLEHVSTPVTMDETEWVPDWLPPYAKVLMSVGTHQEDGLYQELRDKIPSEENFFELLELDEMDAFKIVQGNLHDSGRGLAEKQAMSVAYLVQGCPHPVFLRMLTDMAITWPSFYFPDPENPPVQPAVEAIITLMLKQLEFKHGTEVVSVCLCYLSSARRGLREVELLDLLSLDDDLLSTEVFPHTDPLRRRFPTILWLRLKWEIAPYLEMRESDGHVVICWTNELVRRSVYNRYLSGADRRQQIHRLMADYFMGTWADRAKPFRYTEDLADGTHLTRRGARSRYVPKQPLMFTDLATFHGKSRPNKRKLSELPFHLLQGDRLPDLCTQVLYSYTWLYTRLSTSSLNDLIEDLEDILNTPSMRASRDLEILIEVLQDSELVLSEDVNFLKAELTSRLLQHLGRHNDLTYLVRMCDIHGFHHNKLSPVTPFLDSSKDEVIHMQQCDAGLNGHLVACLTPMANYIITYTIPQRLLFWNIQSGDKVEFECDSNSYYVHLKNSDFREWTLALNDGKPKFNYLEDTPCLDIYENDSMSRHKRITFEKPHGNSKLRKLYRMTCLNERKVVFETFNYVAVYLDTVRLCNLNTGEEVVNDLPWPYLVAPDENYVLVTNIDAEGVWVREFPSFKTVAKLLAPKHVTAIVTMETNQGLHVLVSAGSCGILCLFSLEDITEDEVDPIMVSPLLTKSSSSVKGGIGQILMSADYEVFIAFGVHSRGKDIFQTNYVALASDLSLLGSYKCDRGDTSVFSSDSKYIFHLRKKKHDIAILDSLLVTELAVYPISSPILQCIPTTSGANVVITTPEFILEVDMETVVKRELMRKEGSGGDDVDGRENSRSGDRTSISRRAILAELDVVGLNLKDLEEKIPLQILYMDNATGLVESELAILHRGEQFSEFDLPAFSSGSEVMLTPDGKRLLGLCDQIHVWLPKRCTVILVVPLIERTGYTKVFLNDEQSRRDLLKNDRSEGRILCKDVSAEGLVLEKGAYVYRELGPRKHILYEARGGEIIQRIPSVVRVYDILTREIKAIIRIQNEKVITCNNETLVTVSLMRDFTNMYNLRNGDQIITIECKAEIAMFCPSDDHLLVVSKELKSTIKIYTGHHFLDSTKIKITKKDNEYISSVTACSREPNTVVVCITRTADILYNIAAGTEYATVDLETGDILIRFEPKAEVIHISPNAIVAVDREFIFYDLITGETLFQYAEGKALSGHISYFTDDGEFLMFLDTDSGTVNTINIGKKKRISKCLYHKFQSKLDRLQGRHSIATLLPLYGGYHCVIMDGSQLKQFSLISFDCWKSFQRSDADIEQAYSGSVKRATFLHARYKDDHSPVELANLANKLRFVRVASVFKINSRARISPIERNVPQILAL